MNNFFAQFRGFDYDRTNAPEQEFERLRVLQQWNEGTKTYRTHRCVFLAALLAQTMSPVHRFFIETYPFACYNPIAHPKHEFSRLAESRKWKATNRPYRKAEVEFNKAYQKEFGSRMLDFFEEYEEEFEGFEYNPRSSPEVELDRLAEFNGWGYRSMEWREALDSFHDAIRFDFNETFGCDDDDIDGWRFLCKVLGVRGAAPETAEACRKAVIDKHCNIYDLLKYVRDGCPKHEPLQFFKTIMDLGIYSYQSVPKKVYPAREAEKGALKFVLRRIGEYEKLKKPIALASQETGGNQAETEQKDNEAKKGKKRKRRRGKGKAEKLADPAPDGEASQETGEKQAEIEQKDNETKKGKKRKRKRRKGKAEKLADPTPDGEPSQETGEKQAEIEQKDNETKKGKKRKRRRGKGKAEKLADPAPDGEASQETGEKQAETEQKDNEAKKGKKRRRRRGKGKAEKLADPAPDGEASQETCGKSDKTGEGE